MTTRRQKNRKKKVGKRRTSRQRVKGGLISDAEKAAAAAKVAANPVEAEKIHTFMRKPRVAEYITSRFLKNICSDSNVCIAFGIEQPKIYAFFHGYTDKTYMQLPIRPVGLPSRNGFVNEIEYMRDGYVSHAILKSSLKHRADNLVYEYAVGQYMNKMAKFYPCILQTYALIQYGDTGDSYHMMQTSNESITTPEELAMLKLNRVITGDILGEELWLDACQHPLKYAVLTQSIKDAIPFKKIRNERNIASIVLSLHQVYFTLHCMRESFTHYDLHMENVVCYHVGKDKYVEFMYHMKDGNVIRYNYDRLSYILDYGRSYFYESSENNSAEIFDKLCKVPCPTPCGAGDGFQYLFGNKDIYIESSKRNMSADLRLLKLAFEPISTRLFTKIKFDGDYGTPEVVAQGFTKRIYNVSDAFMELSAFAPSSGDELTKKYIRLGFTKMGTLHIYEDGITPMEFQPAAVAAPAAAETPAVAPVAAPAAAAAETPMKAPAAAPLQKIDTRVSSVAMAPYFMDYMNISPTIRKKDPYFDIPPPLRRSKRPPVMVNRDTPLVLPLDKAFYDAETPK